MVGHMLTPFIECTRTFKGCAQTDGSMINRFVIRQTNQNGKKGKKDNDQVQEIPQEKIHESHYQAIQGTFGMNKEKDLEPFSSISLNKETFFLVCLLKSIAHKERNSQNLQLSKIKIHVKRMAEKGEQCEKVHESIE